MDTPQDDKVKADDFAIVLRRLDEIRMLVANLYIRLNELERRVNDLAPRGD